MSRNPKNNQNPNKTTITAIIINHHIQQIQFNNPIHIQTQTQIQIQIQTQLLKQQQQLLQEIHRSHQLHLHHHYLSIFNVIRLMLLMGMERVNIVVGELGMGCMVADMDRVMILINSRNNNTATNTQKTNHHQISQIPTPTQTSQIQTINKTWEVHSVVKEVIKH